MEDDNRIESPGRMLIATFLPHFCTSLFQSAVGPLAPFLQETFAVSRTQIGILASVQFIGSTAMAVPAGALVERLGIRPWIILSPAIFGVCALLFANITSFFQGIILYTITGFAFAFVNPATTKAIIFGFPQERRGTAMGIKQTGVPAGGFVASVAIPVIAVSFGWETSMIFVAVFAIASGICGWFLYGERDTSYVNGNINLPRESSVQKDLAELLRNSDFLLSSGLHSVFGMCRVIIQSYLVLYLVESMNYSIVYAGLVLGVMDLIGSGARILWGLISDLLFAGRRVPTLQIVGFVSVAGLVSLGLVNETTPAWIVWVAVSAAGAGSFGFAGTMLLLRAELAGKHLAATSTGMGGAITSLGILLGPPFFGYIVDSTQSYKIAWLIIAVVALTATLLLRLIHEHEPASKILDKATFS